jgi:hypothetical protein
MGARLAGFLQNYGKKTDRRTRENQPKLRPCGEKV